MSQKTQLYSAFIQYQLGEKLKNKQGGLKEVLTDTAFFSEKKC